MVSKCEDITVTSNFRLRFTDLEQVRTECKGVTSVSSYVRSLVESDLTKDRCQQSLDLIRLSKENDSLRQDIATLKSTLGKRTDELKRFRKMIDNLY